MRLFQVRCKVRQDLLSEPDLKIKYLNNLIVDLRKLNQNQYLNPRQRRQKYVTPDIHTSERDLSSSIDSLRNEFCSQGTHIHLILQLKVNSDLFRIFGLLVTTTNY